MWNQRVRFRLYKKEAKGIGGSAINLSYKAAAVSPWLISSYTLHLLCIAISLLQDRSSIMGLIANRASLRALLIWQLYASHFISIASGLAISRTGNNTFDYVVVGGGNAGLTIASRLSEQPSVRVAIIEAGDYYESTSGNFSSIPANDVYYNGKDPRDTNPLLDWGFTTTPQQGVNNEVVHYARGKTVCITDQVF